MRFSLSPPHCLCAWNQRQNVERAKLALLTDKLDGPCVSYDGYRQSDHLLMMIAYKKWEKIVREVSQFLLYLMICIFVYVYVCYLIFFFSNPKVCWASSTINFKKGLALYTYHICIQIIGFIMMNNPPISRCILLTAWSIALSV